MTKVAAVDLGTNSFLCLIAEVSDAAAGAGRSTGLPASEKGAPQGPRLRVLEDVSRVVRVGEQVHKNRFFLPQALARAEKCLDEFHEIIARHKVDKVIATATSAARDAKNGSELLKLGLDRGIPINIIGGAREAELSFEGAVSAVPEAHNKSILVIDVGGGSTELIFRPARTPGVNTEKNTNQRGAANLAEKSTAMFKAQSFDVGCVRLTEMFLKSDPINEGEYFNLTQYAAKVMQGYGPVKPDLVIAVAGTPTTLACVVQQIDFDERKVEGFILNQETINEMARSLGRLPLNERKTLKGLEPLRADVIIAGCALLNCGLNIAGLDEMRVSTRGLRYGVALHHADWEAQ